MRKDHSKLPSWITSQKNPLSSLHPLKKILRRYKLYTVCEVAKCPNIYECFLKNRFTFIILGNRCTRRCAFCMVSHDTPLPSDPSEPSRIVKVVEELNLNYIVLTSPTRDDLPDKGVTQFIRVIQELKERRPNIIVEILTPDFQGDTNLLSLLKEAPFDVFGHNIETIRRLYPFIKPKANYARSLKVLEFMKKHSNGLRIKSALLVGMGEQDDEIKETIQDLKSAGCDTVIVGQYLRPTLKHMAPHRYVPPSVFKEYKRFGEMIGVKVFAKPLARSSYYLANSLNEL